MKDELRHERTAGDAGPLRTESAVRGWSVTAQTKRHALAWITVLASLDLAGQSARAAEPLDWRWLYLQQNFQVTENMPKVEKLIERAAQAGYNGVVLADYKLHILDRVPEHYEPNAVRFRDLPNIKGAMYTTWQSNFDDLERFAELAWGGR